MAKKKYYVVWQGQTPGVYESWPDAQEQIKGYPGAKYKSFKTLAEAEEAYYGGFKGFSEKKGRPERRGPLPGEVKIPSLCVDAACSGNPGLMEYRGVETSSGREIFHKGPFERGTNNIGEFLALVHGLAYLKKQNNPMPVYSDSKIAIGWIRARHCRTKLKETTKNSELFNLIRRGEHWLKENSFPNPILKWETEKWGEIPADFGRK